MFIERIVQHLNNSGFLFALERLVTGLPSNPVTPDYDPIVLGTMPAVYQLLPRVRHKTFRRLDADDHGADFLSVDFWLKINWGLAAPSKDILLCKLLPGMESMQRRREGVGASGEMSPNNSGTTTDI